MSVLPNLLIIACSNRKIEKSELLPAIERYDGGVYRVLRKAKKDGYLPKSLGIYILSAKFGLIASETPIPHYDLRMTKLRASELYVQVNNAIRDVAFQIQYDEVYVDLGRDYLPAIQNSLPSISLIKLTIAQGRIGERQRNLKQWLQLIG